MLEAPGVTVTVGATMATGFTVTVTVFVTAAPLEPVTVRV
jgi:hypothetical protein